MPPPPPEQPTLVAQSRPGWRRFLGLLSYAQRAAELVWQTDRRLALTLAALTIGSGVLPAAIAYVGKWIVDGVVQAAAAPTPSRQQAVLWLVAVEFGLVVALIALQRGLAVCDALLRVRLAQRVVELVLDKVASLGLVDLENPAQYEKLQQVREHATERPLSLARHALLALQQGVTFAGFLLLLAKYSPGLMALLLVTALPGVLLEARFNADAFRLFRAHSPEARRQEYLETVLTREDHAKEVKLFGLAPVLQARHRQIFQHWYAADRALSVRRGAWGFALGLLASGALAASYAWVAWQAMAGVLSLGALAMLFAVLRQAQGAATELLLVVASMHDDHLYIAALHEFLDQPSSVQAGLATSGPLPGDGLRFEGVSFSYPEASSPAIRELDLHLAPGTKLAVVGRNGAGKSTLVKLALGLYAPSTGRVLLDGRDLREWQPQLLARRFAAQFQDFARYQLSVADNIGFGDVERPQADAAWARAAERAHARSLVESLPHKYETQLGHWFEGGHELSLGEWQKLALARAFMRENADILVLDEPSASLDRESEHGVLSRLQESSTAHSALLISHRLTTLRFANQVLVLEKGQCVARGEHQTLLETSSFYQHLLRSSDI